MIDLIGAITSNMAIVPTTNGSLSAFGYNPTELILDICGATSHLNDLS